MIRSILALGLVLLPLLEIAGFVLVGSEIGVLWTIALVMASGVLGAVLLRRQGLQALRRAQLAAANGGSPDREIVHGAMILVAGILLMIPGFITDIAGLLLFVPTIRDMAWSALRDRIVVRAAGFGMPRRAGAGATGPNRTGSGRVVDLDESEYSAADPKPSASSSASPWTRIDGDGDGHGRGNGPRQT